MVPWEGLKRGAIRIKYCIGYRKFVLKRYNFFKSLFYNSFDRLN